MMRLPQRRFRFTGEHAVADRPSYGALSKDLFHASLVPEGAHDDVRSLPITVIALFSRQNNARLQAGLWNLDEARLTRAISNH